MAPQSNLHRVLFLLIFIHQTALVFGQAPASNRYECAKSAINVSMETLCDGVQDCPRGDDEFFCEPCWSWHYGFFKSPCPNSDTCYTPSSHCDVGWSCPDADSLTDLCWPETKCPSGCLCDVMNMFCRYGSNHKNSTGTGVDPSLKIVSIDSFKEVFLLNGASEVEVEGSNGTSVARQFVDSEATFVFRPTGTKFLMALVVKHVNRLVIEVGAFESNSYLESLHLIDASLTDLHCGMFDGLTRLVTLDLRWNQISMIEEGAFDDLINLQELYLQGSRVADIEPGTFLSQTNMQTIVLIDSYYDELGVNAFEGLESLETLHVTDYRLCCLITNLTECVNYEPGPFSCSGGLLQYITLRILLWALGISAIIGNIVVIVVRGAVCRYPTRPKNRVHSALIANLAIADFLTGAYMIALVVADLLYGVDYLERSGEWRNGYGCMTIGFVIVVSREASLMILSLVALNRSLRIDSPRGSCNLTPVSVGVLASLVWIVSIAIGIVPLVLPRAVDGAAKNFVYADVCFGLPLNRPSVTHIEGDHYNKDEVSVFEYPAHPSLTHAHMFGLIVFLGFNLILLVIIFLLYFVSFVHACHAARTDRIRARRVERGQEVRLALRMALIVGLDFACWASVIALGLLAQFGVVTLPDEIFTWCVVIILPATAAINPWIYTLGDVYISWKRKVGERPRRMYIFK